MVVMNVTSLAVPRTLPLVVKAGAAAAKEKAKQLLKKSEPAPKTN